MWKRLRLYSVKLVKVDWMQFRICCRAARGDGPRDCRCCGPCGSRLCGRWLNGAQPSSGASFGSFDIQLKVGTTARTCLHIVLIEIPSLRDYRSYFSFFHTKSSIYWRTAVHIRDSLWSGTLRRSLIPASRTTLLQYCGHSLPYLFRTNCTSFLTTRILKSWGIRVVQLYRMASRTPFSPYPPGCDIESSKLQAVLVLSGIFWKRQQMATQSRPILIWLRMILVIYSEWTPCFPPSSGIEATLLDAHPLSVYYSLLSPYRRSTGS